MTTALELVRAATDKIVGPNGDPLPTRSSELPLVLIGVPSHDMLHANFAMALAQMTFRIGAIRPVRIGIINVKGSVVHHQRNKIVAEAQRLGASKLLFLDSDMSFPMVTLERLLLSDKAIIGATYAQRTGGHKNLAKPKGNERHDNANGVVQVDALPTGVLLIDMKVFDSLKRPYFRFEYTEEDVAAGTPPSERGEDYEFCRRAREAGIPVWCDVELSWEIIHWGEAGWRLDADLCGKDASMPDATLVQLES